MFTTKLSDGQPSSPLGATSTYITLVLYFAFLFVYVEILSPNVPRLQLYILSVYPMTDWI